MAYYEGTINDLGCNNNGNGAFGNNGDWIWAILLLALLGRNGLDNNGGGNGGFYPYPFAFGGACGGGCATQADVRAAVDQQTLISKIDQQTYGLADSFNSLNNTLNSNFRGVDNAICNLGYNIATQFAGVDKAFCTQGYQTQAGFNALSTQLAQCCCDTRAAIADVKYANERNTCDIIRAGQDNTRAILDYLTGEKIEALRAENVALKGQISNDRQSQYIVSQLREPCPVPAYLTCDPRVPYNYGQHFNNNCGCGCN